MSDNRSIPPAGYDLDVQIGMRIMGWHRIAQGEEHVWLNPQGELAPLPCFSLAVAPAWSVVEHLRKQGCVVIVKADGQRTYKDALPYTVLIDSMPRTDALTMADAICRAALKWKAAYKEEHGDAG